MIAARYQNKNVVRSLIDSGADLSILKNNFSIWGFIYRYC